LAVLARMLEIPICAGILKRNYRIQRLWELFPETGLSRHGAGTRV
jgi:hypothetical protein